MTQKRGRATMATEATDKRIAPIQVTVWGNPADKDLMSWFAWYKDKIRKTPAAIVKKNTANAYVVSVWRYGVGAPGNIDRFLESYEIIEECHGFSRLSGMQGMRDAT
jgi:hypothetical protein